MNNKRGFLLATNAIHMQRYEKFLTAKEKFYEYIKNNSNADPKQLYLSVDGRDLGFQAKLAVMQIECRQKTAHKLSSFTRYDEFLFPSVLASEQSTHQCVAAYHASLVGSGLSVVDMTAGLGIDAFSFARAGNRVTAIELDHERAATLRHNAEVLRTNMVVVEDDSLVWMRDRRTGSFDVLFVDPARRSSDSRRTYFFRDCIPDIVSNISELRSYAPVMMVKASPILDIHQIIKELSGVTSVHLVCVKGECKEVLVICDSSMSDKDPEITAIDMESNDEAAVKIRSEWKTRFSKLGNACPIATHTDMTSGTYLYDPNAAVHKLNCSAAICKDFPELKKLSYNTDLYCSSTLYESFPGRIFVISSILDRRSIKSMKRAQCMIAVRNYPLSAEQLRKKLNASQGETTVIYGCSVGAPAKPTLLMCYRHS